MTRPEIVAILDWQSAHAGQVSYSETAPTRLSSDTAHLASTTDCSGMVARMFKHFAGIDVGTYTGNECNFGQLITTSKANAAAGRGMLPGDVVLFDWGPSHSSWDHIAIYAGHGRIWNHGGPGKGPLDWSLRDNVNNAVHVMVRRFLPNTPSTPAPINTVEDLMAGLWDGHKLTKAEQAEKARFLADVEQAASDGVWNSLLVSQVNDKKYSARNFLRSVERSAHFLATRAGMK